MLFSDLDRTLIYSKVFYSDFDGAMVPVETKEGKFTSHTTSGALIKLISFREAFFLVPVTARTLEQALRVHFIRDQFPEFMVCESGKEIYINGELDTVWESHLRSQLEISRRSREHAYNHISQEFSSYFGCNFYPINESMIMTKIENLNHYHEGYVKSMIPFADSLGCDLILQEKKLYLFPKEITKGNAVKYLIERESPRLSVSSGDAQMDYSMFSSTTHHIAPMHHTITGDIKVTTGRRSLDAAEDIIDYAYQILAYN
ncbi:hypothetical protein ABGV42_01840 [Paenibacillus pabuli]|uniref:hypothetical protein n=1 Tax=Paenibacillus pabuli TaxID=1472 RepID=UPI003242AC66